MVQALEASVARSESLSVFLLSRAAAGARAAASATILPPALQLQVQRNAASCFFGEEGCSGVCLLGRRFWSRVQRGNLKRASVSLHRHRSNHPSPHSRPAQCGATIQTPCSSFVHHQLRCCNIRPFARRQQRLWRPRLRRLLRAQSLRRTNNSASINHRPQTQQQARLPYPYAR
jgi:hypothetical protein